MIVDCDFCFSSSGTYRNGSVELYRIQKNQKNIIHRCYHSIQQMYYRCQKSIRRKYCDIKSKYDDYKTNVYE